MGNSINGMKGHLEVWKVFQDGEKELHFSDHNVITLGMGYTLGMLFNSKGSENVNNYQIQRFALGVSGSGILQVSSTTDLGESLPIAQYGDTNFEMDTEVLIHPTGELGVTGTTSLVSCGIIPFSHIKKISPTRVMWQIFVGENACNGETLNEIGLFSTNPTVVPYPSGERRVLCAYRYFDDINKTEAFSLLFRWTIEF